MYKIQCDIVSGIYYVLDFDESAHVCRGFEDFLDYLDRVYEWPCEYIGVKCTIEDIETLKSLLYSIDSDYR